MRKKYLSALLFGALLFASAGTFTSCKDYDDDINGLRTEITDLKSAITELQNAVQKGKYVTAVSGNGNVITFTFSDGSTTPITVETESGEASQTVTIGEDGELIINGEGTGYYATTEPTEAEVEAGLIKKGANGTWEVLGEDGEYTDTKIPVSGISVSGSEAEGYTFTIVDANGESTIVELPTAASAITGITFRNTEKVTNPTDLYKTDGTTSLTADKKTVYIANEQFIFNGTDIIDDPADWMGNKKLPANKSYIFSSPSEIDLQITPNTLDASPISFYLTNGKNKDVLAGKFTASPTDLSDDDLKNNEDLMSRAAYEGNGLWTLKMENTVIAEGDKNGVVKSIDDFLYSVNAADAFRSAYSLKVDECAPYLLKTVDIQNDDETMDPVAIGTEKVTANNTTQALYKVGQAYKVITNAESALYDMYLFVDESDKNVFGVTFDQDKHTFTIGKTPDVASLEAAFTLWVYTAANDGTIELTKIKVQVDGEITTGAEYSLIEHPVNYVDPMDNHFGIDLSIMKKALGNKLDTWNQNVDVTELSIDDLKLYEDEACKKLVKDGLNGFTATVVEKLAKNNKLAKAADRNTANYIQVNITNNQVNLLKLGKTYYIKATFESTAGTTLNNIVVPVMFTAPSLEEQFVKEPAVFTDNLATAYLNVGDQLYNGKNTNNPAYSLKWAFASMPAGEDVTLALSSTKDLLDDKYSSADLAGVGTSFDGESSVVLEANTKVYLQDISLEDETGRPKGYGQELTIKATDAVYNGTLGTDKKAKTGWLYADGEGEYTFKIKVLSPIYEGRVEAIKDIVEIPATATALSEGYHMSNSDIIGYTYNNVDYAVLPDIVGKDVKTPAWNRPDIKNVTAKSDNERVVIVEGNVQPAVNAKDEDDKPIVISGYFNLKPQNIENEAETTVQVTVEDIWGYKKTSPIKVKVTRDKGE